MEGHCLNDLSSLDSPFVVVHDGRKRGTMRVWDQPDGLCVFMLLVGGLWVISFSVRARSFYSGIQGRPNGDFFFSSLLLLFWRGGIRDQGYDDFVFLACVYVCMCVCTSHLNRRLFTLHFLP